MSLKDLVNEPAVSRRMRETFDKPVLPPGKKLRAAPVTAHYSLVGTAFDYLLRFYAQRLNPVVIQPNTWVAEQAGSRLDGGTLKAASGRVEVVPEMAETPAGKRNAELYLDILGEAKRHLEAYLKTGRPTKALVTSAALLARLDVVSRTGRADLWNVGNVAAGDIKDLQELVRLVPAKDFTARRRCVLNPTFGQASNCVGGADGDLVIDDTLIDIKTTQKYRLQRRDYNQLIGYYCLARLGGIGGLRKTARIKNLAIYFARYGYLFRIPLERWCPAGQFDDFLAWFASRIGWPRHRNNE